MSFDLTTMTPTTLQSILSQISVNTLSPCVLLKGANVTEEALNPCNGHTLSSRINQLAGKSDRLGQVTVPSSHPHYSTCVSQHWQAILCCPLLSLSA